jgi:hypothetical protein
MIEWDVVCRNCLMSLGIAVSIVGMVFGFLKLTVYMRKIINRKG